MRDSATVQTAAGTLAMMKKDDAAPARPTTARSTPTRAHIRRSRACSTRKCRAKNFGAGQGADRKATRAEPQRSECILLAAQTYGASWRRRRDGTALKKTVEADPHSLQAYTMLGKMYYKQGRLDFARRELEKYVTTAPASVPGNTMLGTVLDLQGKKNEAKTRYNKALQIDPRAAVAANNLAWIDANTEGANLDMALQLAQTAKAQLPNRHEVDDTLGWIYYKKGMATGRSNPSRTAR